MSEGGLDGQESGGSRSSALRTHSTTGSSLPSLWLGGNSGWAATPEVGANLGSSDFESKALLDAHGDSLGGFLGEFEDGEGFGVVGVAGNETAGIRFLFVERRVRPAACPWRATGLVRVC